MKMTNLTTGSSELCPGTTRFCHRSSHGCVISNALNIRRENEVLRMSDHNVFKIGLYLLKRCSHCDHVRGRNSHLNSPQDQLPSSSVNARYSILRLHK